MPDRTPRLLCCVLLALAAGCTTVGPAAGPVADRPAPGRELDAGGLRAAVVTDAELGPGYAVTLLTPGQDTAPDQERETADRPACQPVLDAVAPGKAASGPTAEADLSVTRKGDPHAALYAGLLAFGPGRAERLQGELEQVLAHCTGFTSVAGGGAAPGRGVQTRHRLTRTDTPTPEGADAATAFTLTNESGTATLSQHALLARVGTALAVFSTVGTDKEPAAEPDPEVVRAQLAKLRAAQRPDGRPR
ncbi:hypothetical protein AB0K43_04610 [Kitasatospora sp. NPDC049258]|uniref:hypothetical protein n=1 Tax=Kitasatospora sp. NPDC049258 TaxID=3155394 RepID=UPI00343D8974